MEDCQQKHSVSHNNTHIITAPITSPCYSGKGKVQICQVVYIQTCGACWCLVKPCRWIPAIVFIPFGIEHYIICFGYVAISNYCPPLQPMTSGSGVRLQCWCWRVYCYSLTTASDYDLQCFINYYVIVLEFTCIPASLWQYMVAMLVANVVTKFNLLCGCFTLLILPFLPLFMSLCTPNILRIK